MRTKRIKLYQFKELSEEAQTKALKDVAGKDPVFKTGKHNGLLVKIIEANNYEFLKDGTLFS